MFSLGSLKMEYSGKYGRSSRISSRHDWEATVRDSKSCWQIEEDELHKTNGKGKIWEYWYGLDWNKL